MIEFKLKEYYRVVEIHSRNTALGIDILFNDNHFTFSKSSFIQLTAFTAVGV